MTHHLDQRMNQRGIPRELVDFTLKYGEWEGDRCVLNRKAIQTLLDHCDKVRRVALRAMDKGGVVVVEVGGAEITTYNLTSAGWRH